MQFNIEIDESDIVSLLEINSDLRTVIVNGVVRHIGASDIAGPVGCDDGNRIYFCCDDHL